MLVHNLSGHQQTSLGGGESRLCPQACDTWAQVRNIVHLRVTRDGGRGRAQRTAQTWPAGRNKNSEQHRKQMKLKLGRLKWIWSWSICSVYSRVCTSTWPSPKQQFQEPLQAAGCLRSVLVCDVFTCGWGSAGMWPKPESVSQDQNGYQGDEELPLYGSRAALFPRIPAFLVFWVDGQTSFLLGSTLNWTVPSLWTRTTALTVPTLSDLLLLYWLCFSLFLLFLKFWWFFIILTWITDETGVYISLCYSFSFWLTG